MVNRTNQKVHGNNKLASLKKGLILFGIHQINRSKKK